ncbi:hypothetical protein B5C34_12850 [Pacificimonas flava]|uniref:Macro domain-containing protein n=2 Tax=Pacificimonas TaxID=1960290 RepID=A0A219B915_9SPHN|nr:MULTISPECIES: macro domain-containing protein [Pacificimonas]MBZ6378443.1 macro domain-containing protein [Pacificimonas aurantium]OWV34258.1 hypothetical protein B5C34_12850 [Pacificimonas flava]
MIVYHRTSILDSNAQTVVNTVNTVGVMGKGLAKSYKNLYPTMFDQYKLFCDDGLIDIGKLWLWKGPIQWVLNFPTKRHWRYPSKLEYIEAGLAKFVESYERLGIREISFPPLGCGNGNLDWEVVQPLMHSYLHKLPIRIYIHDHFVDNGLVEHRARLGERYPRSFHDFVCDLKDVARECASDLKTIGNSTPFSVTADDSENSLTIRANKKRYNVDEYDLHDFWSLLQKGPVRRTIMSGSAFDAAYYLMAMANELKYVRSLQISDDAGEGAIGVELDKSFAKAESVVGRY